MKTPVIKSQIDQAIRQDKQTGKFASLITDFVRNQGLQPKEAEVQQAVDFVYDYLLHVPELTNAIVQAASKAGTLNEIRYLLESVEEYFLNPCDLIPDYQGVLGLLDDAYLTLSMIQALSDQYKQRTGVPLISLNLTPANQSVRQLLGNEIATMLDLSVSSAMAMSSFMGPLGQLANAFGLTMQVNDPIWGNASIDDIVTARLGAMGVV